MRSVEGYFENRLKDDEYRAAYVDLEGEFQKKRARLIRKLRTREMDENLHFLEGFLVKNSDAFGWLARWANLKRMLEMTNPQRTVPFVQQAGQGSSGAQSAPYIIAASTIETNYNANVPEIS